METNNIAKVDIWKAKKVIESRARKIEKITQRDYRKFNNMMVYTYILLFAICY